MNHHTRLSSGTILVFLFVALFSTSSFAQIPDEEPISDEVRSAVIDTVAKLVADQYLFPDVAAKMEKHIRKQQRAGAYDSLNSLFELTGRLTEELREICHDGHMTVVPIPPGRVTETGNDSLNEAKRVAAERDYMQYANYGFIKVERLDGNVGLIKLNQFYYADVAGPTAVAAMNFLGHSDALIFDLRENGGGDPSMIQLLTSYLYEEPQHLNSFETRGEDREQQFWSHAFVPGPRLPEAPVYILTSSYTYSGAEEFSYNMQNLKRATIVGETTGGGAHFTREFYLFDLGLEVCVPHARAVNPVSGSNWEGSGVQPDIECPADKALDIAYMEILKSLREEVQNPKRRESMDWIVEGLEARANPVTLSAEELQKYTGTYGPRVVTLEGETLLYRRGDRPQHKLIPFGNHLFALEGTDDVRFEFIVDDEGRSIEIIGHYQGSYTDSHKRSE